MYTKIIYVIIDCLAVADILITFRATGKIREAYGKWLRNTLAAGVLAIIANIFIALSVNETMAALSYCFYFASIDWIIFFLWGFCMMYTEHERMLKRLSVPLALVMCGDSLSILMNFMFGHHFRIYEKSLFTDIIFYQTAFRPAYYVHLAIDYITLLTALFFILYRIKKSYSIYRAKYVIMLSVLVFVILLNVAYMALSLVLDASVIFYAVAGTLIYFCIKVFVPRNLMMISIGHAVDDMNEGLILFDISNHCIYANAFAKNRFGINEEFFSFDVEPAASVLRSLKSDGEPYGTVNYTRETDRAEHYRIRYNKLSEKKGRPIGSYFLIEDMTETYSYLKEINEAKINADRANQAKSAFLASMSHEIRTPLNSVLGLNELILRSTEDPQLREYAEGIRDSGDALLGLINDILDFSKIEASRMDIINEDYSPHDLLRDCYSYFEQMAHAKDLYITVVCNEDLPAGLNGDRQHIRQVLFNIISNAIKYTNEGGVTIRMSCGPVEHKAVETVFVVSDTGIGIAKEDLSLLFDPFRRVNEKQTANIQGTGLGLAITKELVSLMRGRIQVDSTPGKGSTFRIIIPQSVTDPSPAGRFNLRKPQVIEEYHERFKAPTASVLVVDDVPMNLKVIVGLLRPTLVRVTQATGGEEAVELCARHKYDVVLLDHRMPHKDGVETFREIRAEGMNTDTPVIMLTANAISGAAEEYKKEGFADYLTKPVLGADLEKSLLRFIPKEKII
ncbi:MAG: response regulator [Lachnospiraceae bacterium]|nr:response regulator [Lachnospiraceae bacterium]